MYAIWVGSENCRGTESRNVKGEEVAGERDEQEKWKAVRSQEDDVFCLSPPTQYKRSSEELHS